MSNIFSQKQGLYDRINEHDSCGIVFVAHIIKVKNLMILSAGVWKFWSGWSTGVLLGPTTKLETVPESSYKSL